MRTLCAICRYEILPQDFEEGQVADHEVYDFDGYLDYIELAHLACAKYDDTGYWEWD